MEDVGRQDMTRGNARKRRATAQSPSRKPQFLSWKELRQAPPPIQEQEHSPEVLTETNNSPVSNKGLDLSTSEWEEPSAATEEEETVTVAEAQEIPVAEEIISDTEDGVTTLSYDTPTPTRTRTTTTTARQKVQFGVPYNLAATDGLQSASKIAYLAFDLETTGFSPARDNIIEIGAVILDPTGVPFEDGAFQSYVSGNKQIPLHIVSLTGITNDKVANAPTFDVAFSSLLRFVHEKLMDWSSSPTEKIARVCFVAHNGQRFDLPFLLKQVDKYKVKSWGRFFKRWKPLYLDTLLLTKDAVKAEQPKEIPNSYRLSDLYEYVTGKNMDISHRANADVSAMATILRAKLFWGARLSHLYSLPLAVEASSRAADDSDTDLDESDDDDTDEDNKEPPTRIGWTRNEGFDGVNAQEKFDEVVKRRHTRQSNATPEKNKIGLQCSRNSVNTPAKAWRQVFISTLLNKIVANYCKTVKGTLKL